MSFPRIQVADTRNAYKISVEKPLENDDLGPRTITKYNIQVILRDCEDRKGMKVAQDGIQRRVLVLAVMKLHVLLPKKLHRLLARLLTEISVTHFNKLLQHLAPNTDENKTLYIKGPNEQNPKTLRR